MDGPRRVGGGEVPRIVVFFYREGRQRAGRGRTLEFDGALREAGRGLEDILWRVVCAGETLPVAEKALAWPARSGKLVLKLALDRVADFYRIN